MIFLFAILIGAIVFSLLGFGSTSSGFLEGMDTSSPVTLTNGQIFYGPSDNSIVGSNSTISVVPAQNNTQSLIVSIPSPPSSFTSNSYTLVQESNLSNDSSLLFIESGTTTGSNEGKVFAIVTSIHGKPQILFTNPKAKSVSTRPVLFTLPQTSSSTGNSAPTPAPTPSTTTSTATPTSTDFSTQYFGSTGSTTPTGLYAYAYESSLPSGIQKSQIPTEQQDLYVLKSQVVPLTCGKPSQPVSQVPPPSSSYASAPTTTTTNSSTTTGCPSCGGSTTGCSSCNPYHAQEYSTSTRPSCSSNRSDNSGYSYSMYNSYYGSE